jgi:small-conductance mechanosensitive channel
MDAEIMSATGVGLEVTNLLMPFISALLLLVITLWFKDYATKIAKGVAFQMNKDFAEGDKVILDGERALIVKIGLTQTVFGINKKGGEYDGDYVWRYVPNERISVLKIEKVIFDSKPAQNEQRIAENGRTIEEMKNGGKK